MINNLVSIIIVNYNSYDYLINCIDSIKNSKSDFSYEIIVVDNASTDNTAVDFPRTHTDIKFISNEFNNGFASANNQGIEVAVGEYILLLNPDIVVFDYSLDSMAKFLKNNPKAGGCGCKVVNDDMSFQASYFGFPSLIKEFGHLLRIDRNRWLLAKIKNSKIYTGGSSRKSELIGLSEIKSTIEVDYLLGACLMVKKVVIDKVGPLDDKIFMYIEDTEWCFRIKKSGYGIHYVPTGKVLHYGGKSAETIDQRMLFEYSRSRLYFYGKAYGLFQKSVLKMIIVTDMVIKSLFVWFSMPKLEMKQLQSRYKNVFSAEQSVSARDYFVSHFRSVSLYFSIIKMAIFS